MDKATIRQRNLNQGQLDILKLLYKFRFATPPLLAKALKLKNSSYINSRLNVLEKHKYIGRKYDKSYKLLGKPASYYLLPAAFPLLKKQDNVSVDVLKNAYKDQHASDIFIQHCLSTFDIANHLIDLFDGRLDFFGKSELASYEHFPRPLPDGFITLRTSDSSRARERHYFIDIVDERKPFFTAVQRLNQYLDYADNGAWENATNLKLPKVLFVCETATLEKRLQKHGFRIEDNAVNGLRVYATTLNKLMDAVSFQEAAWLPLVRLPEQLLMFEEL